VGLVTPLLLEAFLNPQPLPAKEPKEAKATAASE
jgi:hypothetical protein